VASVDDSAFRVKCERLRSSQFRLVFAAGFECLQGYSESAFEVSNAFVTVVRESGHLS